MLGVVSGQLHCLGLSHPGQSQERGSMVGLSVLSPAGDGSKPFLLFDNHKDPGGQMHPEKIKGPVVI